MPHKKLIWVGTSLAEVRDFPNESRRRAGYQLLRVQHGEDPEDWKPMPTVGSGVREIRIHTEGEYRVFYVASFADGVYVLHAFQKKTQKTRPADIDVGRTRFAEVVKASSRR